MLPWNPVSLVVCVITAKGDATTSVPTYSFLRRRRSTEICAALTSMLPIFVSSENLVRNVAGLVGPRLTDHCKSADHCFSLVHMVALSEQLSQV